MMVFEVERNFAAYRRLFAGVTLLASLSLPGRAQTAPLTPGAAAVASSNSSSFTLGDSWIQVQGSAPTGKWNGVKIVDRASQHSIEQSQAFSLTLKNGSV